MRRCCVRPIVCGLLLLSAPAAGRAQDRSPEPRLDQGIAAYRELEMESAGWLLRQALAGDRLAPSEHVTALSYLGAAEFYRDRRDSALAAYGRLVRIEPHHRLDRLVFGPDVQAVFEEARRRTPVAEVRAAKTSFPADAAGLPMSVRVNTPHVVAVTIESVSGSVLDTLFRDRVRDSTTVYWNARGRAGTRAPVGGYVVGVASLDGRGRVSRRVTLPVQVTRSPEAPLGHPERPAMLPETQPAGPAFARLGLGLAAATAAWFITPVFTDNAAPQVALSLTFGAAGVLGFVDARPGKPLPDNVVANRVALEAWEARVARVRAENGRRAEGGTVTVDVGRVSGF
jgi:hypothetical protein